MKMFLSVLWFAVAAMFLAVVCVVVVAPIFANRNEVIMMALVPTDVFGLIPIKVAGAVGAIFSSGVGLIYLGIYFRG